MAEEDFEDAAAAKEALKRLGEASGLAGDKLTEFFKKMEHLGYSIKHITEFAEKAIKTQKDYQAKAQKSFDQQKINIDNLSEKFKSGAITADGLNEELANLRGQINRTANAEQKAALIKQKAGLEEIGSAHLRSKMLGDSMGLLSGTVIKGVGNAFMTAATRAMAGGTGIEVASEFMKSGIDVANSASQVGASALTSFGTATAGAGGKVGAMGKVAVVAGTAIGFLSNSISELAKAGIGFMVSQTTKLIGGFNTMSNAGAIYAGGLVEMTKTANSAGMTLEMFSKAVADNRDVLARTGMGVGESSKKLAKSMAAGGEPMRLGMFALGLSMEEQADAMAKTMSLMAGPSGKLKASDKEVAEQTMIYARNLKILATMTGEDGKAKQEKIRQENDNLFMNQEIAKMDEAQRTAFNAMLLTMNESDRRALAEKMKYGNVISTDLAAAAATSPAIGKKWDQIFQSTKDGSMSAEKGRQIQTENAEEIRRQTVDQRALAIANSQTAMDISKVSSEQLIYASKNTIEGKVAAEKAAKAQEDAAKLKDKEGKALRPEVQIQELNRSFAVSMESLVLPNLAAFGKALDLTMKNIQESVAGLVKMSASGGTAIGSAMSSLLSTALEFGPLALSLFGLAKGAKVVKELGAAGEVAGGAAKAAGGLTKTVGPAAEAAGGATKAASAGGKLAGVGKVAGAVAAPAMAVLDVGLGVTDLLKGKRQEEVPEGFEKLSPMKWGMYVGDAINNQLNKTFVGSKGNNETMLFADLPSGKAKAAAEAAKAQAEAAKKVEADKLKTEPISKETGPSDLAALKTTIDKMFALMTTQNTLLADANAFNERLLAVAGEHKGLAQDLYRTRN